MAPGALSGDMGSITNSASSAADSGVDDGSREGAGGTTATDTAEVYYDN